ncbi:MAG: hypothetical protein BroJett040_00080 [Oligoflexia bacterium]|nr:MAG: hypothetical protein BroJett040_00080 [Oligoflexia bacterium]
MEFNFTPPTVREWRDYLSRTTKATWMQTIAYASAARKVDQRSTRFARIVKNNEVIGIVAIQELKVAFIHFVSIYRGPLWFDGQNTEENIKEFISLFNQTFPKRLFRRIRWMPEWSLDETNSVDFIEKSGLQRANETFETLWVDIRPSLEDLRKKLDQKWRNALNKSERSPLQITVDTRGKFLNLFLKEYDIYKAQKKFVGPTGRFFKAEIETALQYGDAIILWARLNNVPVAGIIVMKHGKSASYRVGWNSHEGRDHNAHYCLLWKAIEVLKADHIEHFDLGGILPDEKDGLTRFKLGLSGTRFKTEVLK